MQLADKIHSTGLAVVWSGHKERAELYWTQLAGLRADDGTTRAVTVFPVGHRGSVRAVPLALTGYEIGLLASALVFIFFALLVALVVPRSRPEFPSRYLGWFIAACIVLFAVQMTAVILLAELGEEEHAEVARGDRARRSRRSRPRPSLL